MRLFSDFNPVKMMNYKPALGSMSAVALMLLAGCAGGDSYGGNEASANSTSGQVSSIAASSDASLATQSSSSDFSESSSDSSLISSSSAASTAVLAEAGDDVTTQNSRRVLLSADASRNLVSTSTEPLSYSWVQTAGPAAEILNDSAATSGLVFITPSDEQEQTLTFELTAMTSEGEDTDTVDVVVMPCQVEAGVIFDDCMAPGFGPIQTYQAYDDRGDLGDAGTFSNKFLLDESLDDDHLQWEYLDVGGDRGRVLQVTFGANDLDDNDTYDNGWFGIGSPAPKGDAEDERLDLSMYEDAHIQFDIRVLTDTTIRMEVLSECFWPCVSEARTFLPNSEWQTITLSLADIKESGANLEKLTTALAIRPPWNVQNYSIYQIDNVQIIDDYVAPPEPTIEMPRDIGPFTFWDENGFDGEVSFDTWSENIIQLRSADGLGLNFSQEKFANLRWSMPAGVSDAIAVQGIGVLYHATLELEYTMLDYGGSEEGVFVINGECGFQCFAFPSVRLPRSEVDTRQTYSIPLAELSRRGLALEQTYGLTIRFVGQEFDGPEILIHSARLVY